MATSNVDIANIALQMLGEPPITSLTGTQQAQVLCAQALPFARDEVLVYKAWSVAVTRKLLNQLEEVDNLTGYTYAYTIPPDSLRILAIKPNETTDPAVIAESDYPSSQNGSSYVLENGMVFTNAKSAYAQYIRRIENPSALPGYLVDVIAANIARRIAFSLVQNPQFIQLANSQYANAMSYAMQMDGLQQVNTPPAPKQWSEVF